VPSGSKRQRASPSPDAGSATDPVALGREAETPAHIPWRGWKAVLHRVAQELISDKISLVAAGCAFWATLALFPAITTLIFLYGLLFDPVTIEPQLQHLRELLPPAAYQLIEARLHQLVSQPSSGLTIGIVISTLITFWSASTGTKSVISALNMAYEEIEHRSIVRFQLTGLIMTLGGLVSGALAIAILVFLPAVISFVGLSAYQQGLISILSIAVLMAFVMFSLSLLYRFGPCRREAKWRWITPGSLVATFLWLIASALLSFYVGHIASYDATYGPLGAVAAIMMWFWITAYAVLLGAELNSELELQTRRDSTTGPPKPMGRRGAFVADHVADS
jgi:membrane protein